MTMENEHVAANTITDEMVEAGLAHYAEGGCSGLDADERREVVTSIIFAALAAAPKAEPVATIQSRVQPWMMACFGPEISADKLERGDRFLEEAIELLQSVDYPRERIYALIEYVYGRDQGEINQEVGGVMITLAALCLAHGQDMHEAGETELARIWTKVEKIRAKHAAKPTGSALPIAVAAPPAPSDEKHLRQDVIELVIAAREFWEAHNDMSAECRALDKALEAFSSRVPYENQTEEGDA